MRTAIVHYWLVSDRGGEKVLRALCDLFPDAVIFTHVADDAYTAKKFAGHEIRKTFISRLPFAEKHYEKYLPLMPRALEALDLQEFDLVISSEAGPAKGIIPRPDSLHACYCHSPMRYIWDKYWVYRSEASLPAKAAMSLFAPGLRQWDVASSARVDRFIANSEYVARRIEKFFRREADVIPPPVDVSSFENISPDLIDHSLADAYLWAGQLVSYKRPDVAIEAFTKSRKRLIVIGEGGAIRQLQKNAGPNIEFWGRVDFDRLRSAYASCRALVFPGEEDFGIVPVEAMAAGTPVIALGRGGALDTVKHGKTGILYKDDSAAGLAGAVEEFESCQQQFQSQTLKAHAARFSEANFKAKISSFFRSQNINLPTFVEHTSH